MAKTPGQNNTSTPSAATAADGAGAAAPTEKTTPTGDTNAELTIPTLGTGSVLGVLSPGAAVVQDGEDAGALAQTPQPAAAPPYAPAGSLGNIGMSGATALQRPAIYRNDREQFEPQTGVQSLRLSDLDARLEELRRSDQRLEVANHGLHFESYAAHLAFNEEWTIIRIHETNEVGAEDPVPLSVNGTTVLVKRGVDSLVRRKYVELLMRMKPQNVSSRIDRSDPDNIKNFIEKRSALKHPFSLVRDDNPMSVRWVNKIMAEV